MVLAAGLGTRLRPLTDDRPKALVEIGGRSMLEITLERLRTSGVREVIVNVHHFADRVIEHLATRDFGMRIEISREDDLLDTGGGLRKAAWFFLEDPERLDEPFVLYNVDVVSSIDLNKMRQFHLECGALATLAVLSCPTTRPLLFDAESSLCGHRVGASQETIVVPGPDLELKEFTGIHIISPRLLPLMEKAMELAEAEPFPIIPAYLRLRAAGHLIVGFDADEYAWRDVGSSESLAEANREFSGTWSD